MGDKGRVIGLTGNVACGKSTVARMISELGVPIVDADQVSREIMKPDTAVGETVLKELGTLDRIRLREIVFHSEVKRRRLEAIVHPAIQKRSKELIAELLAKGHSLVVYEASLLVEAGSHRGLGGLLVVTCPESIQRERLLDRDPSLSDEFASRIISAQLPQEKKIKEATWVIDNGGTLDELRAKVLAWHRALPK